MGLETLGVLLGLSLVDSTSFGTLLIPIWMMLSPRLRPSLFVVYLATVMLFYFVVGLVLFVAADAIASAASSAQEIEVLSWAQLAVGVALVAWSFRLERTDDAGDRAQRLRARLDGSTLGCRGAIGLALTATLLEVAMMLPYLGAIGLITTADLSPVAQVGLLAVYTAVMVLPAVLLLALRLAVSRRLTPVLERIGTWMAQRQGEIAGWTVGILGALLALNAASRLF